MNNKYHKRFLDALTNIPSQQSLVPCHTYLLVLANYGCLAGLSDDEIMKNISHAIVQSGRKRSMSREIASAIHRARQTFTGTRKSADCQPIVTDRIANSHVDETVQSSLHSGTFSKLANIELKYIEYDLWSASYPRIPENTDDDGVWFLQSLYDKDDILCLGDKYSTELKTRDEWIEDIQKNGNRYPQIVINPLTGKQHVNKDGKLSYRCDAAVAEYKYALIEFDQIEGSNELSIDKQLAFFANVRLPIVSLTYSGKKSVHALVSLMGIVNSPDEWEDIVKQVLFDRIVRPLGGDAANSNPSRMSRMPGYLRDVVCQKLLYINNRPAVQSIL